MKTNLENITSLLCECEEVNKQIKEIKFGCELRDKDREDGSNTFYCATNVAGGGLLISSDEADDHCGYEVILGHKCRKIDNFEIIGNPIEYHHLMMFSYDKLKNHGKIISFAIGSSGLLIGNRNEEGSYTEIQLDYLKPLSEQSEETLGKIFNFLKG